jgi:hypothetical protein
VRRREVTGFEEDQIVVRVWYRDGTQDSYPTSGGETWALCEELDQDPEVTRYDVDGV